MDSLPHITKGHKELNKFVGDSGFGSSKEGKSQLVGKSLVQLSKRWDGQSYN